MGKTLSTGNNTLLITAWDIDLPGTIDSGSGLTRIMGSFPNQTFGVGMFAKAVTH